MKKKKPSKRAGNKAKNESNKGDNKGKDKPLNIEALIADSIKELLPKKGLLKVVTPEMKKAWAKKKKELEKLGPAAGEALNQAWNEIAWEKAKGKAAYEAAKPFIDGRKKDKGQTGTLREFLEWKQGKESRIKKQKNLGRGWKGIIFGWMKNDGVAIEKTAAYKYLGKYF